MTRREAARLIDELGARALRENSETALQVSFLEITARPVQAWIPGARRRGSVVRFYAAGRQMARGRLVAVLMQGGAGM